MKKFFVSFWAYFKSVTYAPIVRIPVLSSVLVTYFILGITVFGGVVTQDGWAMLISFACGMIFLAGLMMSNYFKRKPDLASLMPISPERSLVYKFLSVIFMFLIMLVAVALFIAVIGGIVFLFSRIPGCNGEFTEEDTSEIIDTVGNSVGVYGGLFGFCYFIIMYSAGMISGLIQRRKNRNIYFVCLCAGILLSMVLMNLPLYLNSEYASASNYIVMSPLNELCYKAMALPQLCIALWAVVAAAMLGWAIYLGIQENKLKSSY